MKRVRITKHHWVGALGTLVEIDTAGWHIVVPDGTKLHLAMKPDEYEVI